LQRNKPLTNPFLLGSRMTQPTKCSSPRAKNLQGRWSRIMPLTSPNSKSSKLNESPNFPTWNGTTFSWERPSTLTLSSPECSQLPLTAERSKTSANLSCILEPPNQQNLLT